MKITSLLAGVLLATTASAAVAEPVSIPSFTAYAEPKPEGGPGLDIRENNGVYDWSDASQHVVFYGGLPTAGELKLAVKTLLPKSDTAKWRAVLEGVQPTAATAQKFTLEADATGTGEVRTVDFGTVHITQPGYYRLSFSGLEKSGATFGDLKSVELDGPAAAEIQKQAAWNFSKWRSPASVHLGYQIPPVPVEWFYTEVTPTADPVHTYYCAAGFSSGYFGIQVNSPTERRIIFSVWDNASEAKDRANVSAKDRTALVAKGKDVVSGDFGNEGTGGHSHLVYNWKTGSTQRFLVAVKPDGDAAIFAGYYWFPETKKWTLISAWRRPRTVARLTGLYAFNEVFGGSQGQYQRRAEFGNSWIKTFDGRWMEINTVRFTRTGRESPIRKDYGGGVTGAKSDRFYLVNGGYITEKTEWGDLLTRMPSGQAPKDIDLPVLPAFKG